MTDITKKDVLSYVFMPQLRSRFGALFASGFQHIPYFIALVYQIVRLLPNNHPYTMAENMGKFGVRHVIAEAANHLVLSRRNIDQIFVFILTLLAMVLFIIQIAMLGMAIFIQPVLAQATIPSSFDGFFLLTDDQASQDLAFILLDMVFGVEGLFNSCVGTAVACVDVNGDQIVNPTGQWLLSDLGWPFPIHVATHQMFQLYSTGLLVVASLIASYFIATVILETAQSGTPFGKRFNKVWAPIRIVVAIGLLVPLQNGLNSAQYIVLYAAKFGSAFATNGWVLFNDGLGFDAETGNTLLGSGSVVATPSPPEIKALLQMLYVAKICREAELVRTDGRIEIEPYLVKNPLSGAAGGNLLLNPSYGTNAGYTTYEELIAFADGASQVHLRFGPEPDKDQYNKEMGYVPPTCGEIIIPLTDSRVPGSANPPDKGAEILQRAYWWMIQANWYWVYHPNPGEPRHYTRDIVIRWSPWLNDETPSGDEAEAVQFAQNVDLFKRILKSTLTGTFSAGDSTWVNIPGIGTGAINEQLTSPKWNNGTNLENKGWGGAAIWYNSIAELNGSLSAALFNLPIVSRYPDVMEYVLNEKQKHNQTIIDAERFDPKDLVTKEIAFDQTEKGVYAKTLNYGFKQWEAGGHGSSSHTIKTNNVLVDTINQFLGTSGLFDMRSDENRNVHPLAQLTSVGRSLIQSAISSLGYAAGAAVVGGDIGQVGVGLFMTVTTIGMTIGFILFYVVPFLPFIYFFFALGGWVKGIFEAMVGAPLWALAHIRIDGNGLPGQAAVNGYFLIFEIFLRPILIIFGLLASISIFSALVSVLNDVWDLVTVNLAGFDSTTNDADVIDFFRNPIDEFFFTVVYAIVVYMMGMSSFKLIDLIPNNILRWMGQSVSTFNDQREDAAQSMVGTASVGGQQAVQSIGGGVEKALGSVANRGPG